MLSILSTQVRVDLRANNDLVALLSNAEGVRALMADAEDGDSFITYYLKYSGKESKDGVSFYQLTIVSWAPDYDKSVALADQVTEALKASENYYSYISGEPKYNEQNEIYTEQIFNIKQ